MVPACMQLGSASISQFWCNSLYTIQHLANTFERQIIQLA